MSATESLETQFIVRPVNCPACGARFPVLHVRTAALRPKQMHSDFCVEWYGPNPDHYIVQVCPNCLYAAYRDDFDSLAGDPREWMLGDVAERKARFGSYRFQGMRDAATVQASYELALRCYAVRQNKRFALYASLCLHMAWLAREEGQPDREQHYLQLALNYYLRSYSHDKLDEPKDEIRQTYLIGELSLRLGQYDDAVRWFHETVSHAHIGEAAGLESRARERWAAAREKSRQRR